MLLDMKPLQDRFNGLPVIYDGDKYRLLGRIKTGLRKLPVPLFSAYLLKVGNPVVDLTTLAAFDRYQKNVPILDQGQVGSCVGHGHTSMVMKARDLSGMTYEALSADSLYAQIDGDRDQGSDPADAITALQTNGICLLSDVPDNFILWSNISAAAKQNALRFRISSKAVYQCANLAELVTADLLGFATTLTVNVGGNFNNLNSNGMVPFAPGYANHCVSGGEGFNNTSDGPLYRFRNSWTSQWGDSGCAWVGQPHIDQQPGVELYAVMWVLEDPQDPTNIPVGLI